MSDRIYYFMDIAIKEAQKAFDENEVPCGCVIVKDGIVISRAHNSCKKYSNSLKHAEIVAIEDAMDKLGCDDLSSCELFVTLEPCLMCAGAIMQSNIKDVYFGAYDYDNGAMGSKILPNEIYDFRTIRITGGIREEATSKLMKDFFARLREAKGVK